MPKLPRLSQRDVQLIVTHCEELLQQAENALFSLRSVPLTVRDDAVKANIDYWINFKSAMRSAIHQAKMRQSATENVISTSI